MVDAYSLKALPALGIDAATLGCVMLDVDPIDLSGLSLQRWEYRSTNPDRKWISGIQTKGQHITLLYGLLSNAHVIRAHVDEVMDGWQPGTLSVQRVMQFPSMFPDEPYVCLVGALNAEGQEAPPSLVEAHQRLSYLPHIDTHAEYKPHLTLAYVQREYADSVQTLLQSVLPRRLTTQGLNYGYEPGKTEPTDG